MRDKVRVGVVGCGVRTQIAHLPALKRNKRVKVVTLCDSDIRKLEFLGEKYGVKKREPDFEKVIQDPELDALIIATPNYLHSPMTLAALEYGKDVLCELPMALNSKEAEEMIRKAKRKKRRLAVCLTYRFRPDVKTLKRFIDSGELGRLYYAKAGWLRGREDWPLQDWRRERLRSGGGAFLTLGSPILSFVFWLLGKRPLSIIGSLHKPEFSSEIEDSAFAFLRLEDGLTLTLEVGWSMLQEKEFNYLNIFGERGASLLNPLQIHREMHGHLVNVTPSIERKNFYKTAYQEEIDSFIDSIIGDKRPLFPPEEGLLVVKVSDAFYESVTLNREVMLH